MGIFDRFRGGGKPSDPTINIEKEDLQPTDKEIKEANKTKMDEALNDPKFTAFLEKFGDTETVDVGEDSSEILERYEMYQTIGSASKEIKSVLREEIFADTQINLTDKELECVNEFMESLAVEGGKGTIETITKTMAEFRELKRQIETEEQGLSQRSEAFEKRKAAFDAAKDIKPYKRVLERFLSKDEAGAIQEARKAGVEVAGFGNRNLAAKEEEFKTEGSTIDNLKSAQEARRKQCAEAREVLLGQFAEDSGAMNAIRQKIADRLTGMVTEESKAGKLDDAQSQLEQFKSVDSRYVDEERLGEDFQKELDKYLKERLGEMIKTTLGKLKSERGQLDTARRNLDQFFKREVMGSASGEEVKEFVGQTITEAYKDLSYPQKLLVRKVCAENGIDLANYVTKTEPKPEDDEETKGGSKDSESSVTGSVEAEKQESPAGWHVEDGVWVRDTAPASAENPGADGPKIINPTKASTPETSAENPDAGHDQAI
ncbi:MAG: hypothetical protein WC080_03885 [Patescibacteria group bacterium]|jgi:hypothetical protein